MLTCTLVGFHLGEVTVLGDTYVGCQPLSTRSNDFLYFRWDGWTYPSTYNGPSVSSPVVAGQGAGGPVIGGEEADITAYANYWDPANGDQQDDYQWVMISDDIGGADDGDEYAQIGPMTGDLPWEYAGNGTTYQLDPGSGETDDSGIFIEYTVNGAQSEVDPEIEMSPGTDVGYKVEYNQEDYETTYWYNTSGTWVQVGPSDDLGWIPTQGLNEGETHSGTDQMYGDINDPETFSDVDVYVDYSGDDYGYWESMDTSSQADIVYYGTDDGPYYNDDYSDVPYMGWQVASDSQLDIYDLGCPNSENSSSDELTPGEVLDEAGTGNQSGSGETLVSSQTFTNGPYQLAMQTDGLLVLSDGNGHVIWTPGSSSGSDFLRLQDEGNFIFENAWGSTVLFNPVDSNGDSDDDLLMQSDGNLVLYETSANQTALWDTGSNWDSNNSGLFYGQSIPEGTTIYSQNDGYRLILQDDGNLVLYNSENTPSFCTGTSGSGSGDFLAMQTDGNLVLYNSSDTALWDSGTQGTGIWNHMIVTNAGTLAVQEANQTGSTYAWQGDSCS